MRTTVIATAAIALAAMTSTALAGWEVSAPVVIDVSFPRGINDAGEVGGGHPTLARTINANTGLETIWESFPYGSGDIATIPNDDYIYYTYNLILDRYVSEKRGKIIFGDEDPIDLELAYIFPDCSGSPHGRTGYLSEVLDANALGESVGFTGKSGQGFCARSSYWSDNGSLNLLEIDDIESGQQIFSRGIHIGDDGRIITQNWTESLETGRNMFYISRSGRNNSPRLLRNLYRSDLTVMAA